jgi:two-component system CheB/CheR fusion protein
MSSPGAPAARGTSPRVAVLAAGTPGPLAQLLQMLPERSGFALIAVCQADVADALRAASTLPISLAHGRTRLEPNGVFVIPPDHEGVFQRDELLVMPAREPSAPLDKLLRSLADEHGARGTAVILEGRGDDGVLGIKRLKEVGGLTIAQALDDDAARGTAELPRAAIAAGMIDLALPLSEIGERMVELGRQADDDAPASTTASDHAPADHARRGAPGGHEDTLNDILVLMRLRSGHDFGAYKRATLYRRVSRRMQVCQCASIAAYHQYLREQPEEVRHLLRDFLISVTHFFRDREAFEALASAVIPKLFAGKAAGDQVRVWIPGCATGEEAYSIAILLREHASTLRDAPQLLIFATDIDEGALAEARAGRYASTIAIDVSPERLQRFFTRDGLHYRVSKELRETTMFSPHNVLRDPPFSRLDLISCRNLLIYLHRDAQDRVLNVFHFGLAPDRFLFLGSSESSENTTLFSALDAKQRLFVRRSNASRLAGNARVQGRWDPPISPPRPPPVVERATAGQLHHTLVERYGPPSLLVDERLEILHVSEHAGQLLQIVGGEPSRQLLRLIHPALRLDLRTAIYAARQREHGSDTRVVRFQDGGRARAIELRVRAVHQPELGPGTLLVLFDELDASALPSPARSAADAAFEPMMHQLEEELHRTRDQLRTTIEQYEISLEELKASNEELQAINEELRSTSEELETSKEELQSVNEELTTLNHELKLKLEEISYTNSDLQNLMASTDIAVVFLDRALHIKRFTPRAQELINLIPSDLGRPLAHLTHRLTTDELPQLAQAVLQTLRTIEREIRTHDGRIYLARLLPYRSPEDRIGGVVLTFVEISDLREAVDARRRSEAALLASEARLRFALRTAPMIIINQDDQLRITWGYVLGHELDGERSAEDVAADFAELFAPGDAARFVDIARQVLHDGGGQRAELAVTTEGELRTFDFRIERNELGLSVIGFDITPSKLAEVSLIDADRRKDEFLATLSHELRNPLTPLQVALDIAKLANGDQAALEHSRGIMERQVAQLTQLVDDLLDLSRITQGKIQIERVAVDPAEIVEAALEATRPLLQQRNHQLTLELPRLPCHVLGDRGRLIQVLTNLLNNAAKYTPIGGHIALALDVDPVRDVLVIHVRDDGDGIAPDMLSKIFEIFVQCRDAEGRARGGLGIGLNLARRLVELHGGRIAAASDGLGRGSEFTIELPSTVVRIKSS